MAFEPTQYRALRLDGAGWVYGLPQYDGQRNLFIQAFAVDEKAGNHTQTFAVDPETLGRYAGVIDNSEAFQGDIFQIEDHGNAVVAWDEASCGFQLRSVHGESFSPDDVIAWLVGNIHQQPELMADPAVERDKLLSALGSVRQIVKPDYHALNTAGLRATHALLVAHLHLWGVVGVNGELTDSEVQSMIGDVLAEVMGDSTFLDWTARIKAELNIDHLGLEGTGNE